MSEELIVTFRGASLVGFDLTPASERPERFVAKFTLPFPSPGLVEASDPAIILWLVDFFKIPVPSAFFTAGKTIRWLHDLHIYFFSFGTVALI